MTAELYNEIEETKGDIDQKKVAELIEKGLIKAYYSGDVTPDSIVTHANIDEMFKYLESRIAKKPDDIEGVAEDVKAYDCS